MVRKNRLKAALLLACLTLPMAACSKEGKQGATDIKTEGVEYVDAFKDLKDPKEDIDVKEDDSKPVSITEDDGKTKEFHDKELGFSISIPFGKYDVSVGDITTEEKNGVKTVNIPIVRGETGGNLASIIVAKTGVAVPGSDDMTTLGAKDGYKYYFKKLREHDEEVKSDNLKGLIKDMQSLLYDIEESFKLD